MASCDFALTHEFEGTELTVSATLDGVPVGSNVVDLRQLVTFGYYSVGKDSGSTQTIPHNTWTRVTGYDSVFSDTTYGGGTYPGLAADAATGILTVQNTGVFASHGYIRWQDGGDAYTGTRSMRFTRNILTSPDSTGKDDTVPNAGNTWHAHSWVNQLQAGTTMSLEVLQDSGTDLTISTAQFKLAMLGLA